MRRGIGWMAAFVMLPAVCFAQEPRPVDRPTLPPGTRVAAPGAVVTPDQQIAALLYSANRNEVEFSQFAETKLQSEEAKAFAAKMVKTHQPAVEKFGKWAGSLVSADENSQRDARKTGDRSREEGAREASDQPRADQPRDDQPRKRSDDPASERSDEDSPRTTNRQARTPAAGVTGYTGGSLDWTQVHKEIADQCLTSTKEAFEQKEAAEFDMCYIGQQIMAHMQAVDKLKVLQKYASDDFRSELEEAEQMAQRHLEEAKKIAASQASKQGFQKTSTEAKANE